MATATYAICEVPDAPGTVESAHVGGSGRGDVKKRNAKSKRVASGNLDIGDSIPKDDQGLVNVDGKKRCVGKVQWLDKGVFKDNKATEGGKVKQAGAVLKTRAAKSVRQPNVNCRVEAFGRMCATFDDLRKRWVSEMGFKSLLYLCGMRLPRTLCYWLMTRVDPINEMFTACDMHRYRLSRNQVRWILGIPNGPTTIPRQPVDDKMKARMCEILNKYGKEWTGKRKQTGRDVTSKGIPITSNMIERLQCCWEQDDELEFKTLFLLVCLHLVLCPTQGPRLATDLLPAVTCAPKCHMYDWCQLVITKLMDNVRSFSRRFYAEGYAGGCGGCSIFLAIFYLDRLDRNPLRWHMFPRIKVWSFERMKEVSAEDRVADNGDYGALGCLDVAYGERHPRDARDSEGPCTSNGD